VMIRDDFSEFRVEKQNQGGSHCGKLQKNMWFLRGLMLSKSWCDFTNHEAILIASVKQRCCQNHEAILQIMPSKLL